MVSYFLEMEQETSSSSTTTRRGRSAGSRNWFDNEKDTLLDIVEEILPAGNKQWELVAAEMWKCKCFLVMHIHAK